MTPSAGQKSSAGPPTQPAIQRDIAIERRPPGAEWQTQLSGRRTMRILHLDTKQVELVRLLFSIGVTVFVGVGSFLGIRYLIGSPV
jgi:hypothetical protein